jgi:pimeloyl-ACP methyl ester carboxylesterase
MELDRVEAGGLGIAYRRAGAGPALVLVHGALGDGRDWCPQLEGLAGELTVVAWDAPGCGGSDDPPERFRLPDFADCLAAFAAAIGLERPHVLGLSFGGGLALELYRRHPGLPRSLLPASAYAGWAGSLPPEVVRERVERADREAGLPPEQWVAATCPACSPTRPRRSCSRRRRSCWRPARPGCGPWPAASPRPTCATCCPASRCRPCCCTATPTAAHRSGRSPPPCTRRSRGRGCGVLPGAGHAANLEVPDRFNAEVREFLSSVP